MLGPCLWRRSRVGQGRNLSRWPEPKLPNRSCANRLEELTIQPVSPSPPPEIRHANAVAAQVLRLGQPRRNIARLQAAVDPCLSDQTLATVRHLVDGPVHSSGPLTARKAMGKLLSRSLSLRLTSFRAALQRWQVASQGDRIFRHAPAFVLDDLAKDQINYLVGTSLGFLLASWLCPHAGLTVGEMFTLNAFQLFIYAPFCPPAAYRGRNLRDGPFWRLMQQGGALAPLSGCRRHRAEQASTLLIHLHLRLMAKLEQIVDLFVEVEHQPVAPLLCCLVVEPIVAAAEWLFALPAGDALLPDISGVAAKRAGLAPSAKWAAPASVAVDGGLHGWARRAGGAARIRAA